MRNLREIIHVFIVSLMVLVFSAAVFAQRPPDTRPDMTITDQTKTQTIDLLAKRVRQDYVSPDVGEKVANMLEEHQSHGDYNSITSAKEFAQLLTTQMHDIAHDGHMGVRYSADEVAPNQAMTDQEKKNNYFFEEIKRLDGNIGYFRLDHVVAAEKAGSIVAGAITFLGNTDALILDLRHNGGGQQEMVREIASYFFSGEKPVLLNTIESRKPGTRKYTTPDQFWTLPYVPAPRYLDKEVYVLISHSTFSGGEELTYDLQTQKRATIVGEPSGGGANPPEEIHIADHFYARIPVARAVNPITHTNWEGVGVKPDIEVPPQDALKVAYKTALEHLIAKTSDPGEQGALKRALDKVGTEPGQQ